jgi:hypothetical protein
MDDKVHQAMLKIRRQIRIPQMTIKKFARANQYKARSSYFEQPHRNIKYSIAEL